MKKLKKYCKFLFFLGWFIAYNLDISYLNTKIYELENQLYEEYYEEVIEYPDIAV